MRLPTVFPAYRLARPRGLSIGLLLCACLAQGGCAVLPGGAPNDSVEDLASMLAGEYNNHAQVWYARQSDEPVPAAFDLAIQRMADTGGPDSAALLYRQFRDDGTLHRESRLLLEASPDGVVQEVQTRRGDGWQSLEGCRVLWRADGEGFRGSTRGDGCRFARRADGETVVFQRRWAADAEGLVLNEEARRPGRMESRTYRFSRLGYYRGWAGVLPDGPGSRGDAEWRLNRQLWLHDGGDTVRVVEGDDPSPYAIRLERLVWPRSGIPMLRLSVLEAESGSIIAYSWAEPGTGSIGLNLGWLQVGLEAEPAGAGPGPP